MTKPFDVYSMGNALVDIEFEIDDAMLDQLGIEKGVMTLIELDRLNELLSTLNHINHKKACGGSASNTIMTTQLLGGKSFCSCKVANDEMGDFFLEALLQHDVKTNLTRDNRETGTTGNCIVKITPDAERTMCTYLGITSCYSLKEHDDAALKQAKYLYIEGYLSAQADATDAVLHAKKTALENNVKTSITLSDPNMVRFCRDNLNKMIGDGVDLLFSNEQEALLFCETDNIESAAETMKTYSKTFAITLGAKGVLIFDGNQMQTVPGKKVNVLNTVGAGDTFAGAFLYGITHGHSYEASARLANIAAGQVVTTLGPRITPEQAKKILSAFAIA